MGRSAHAIAHIAEMILEQFLHGNPRWDLYTEFGCARTKCGNFLLLGADFFSRNTGRGQWHNMGEVVGPAARVHWWPKAIVRIGADVLAKVIRCERPIAFFRADILELPGSDCSGYLGSERIKVGACEVQAMNEPDDADQKDEKPNTMHKFTEDTIHSIHRACCLRLVLCHDAVPVLSRFNPPWSKCWTETTVQAVGAIGARVVHGPMSAIITHAIAVEVVIAACGFTRVGAQ
mmetsp:Transcript_2096/g.6576  ORF Transcript_2096/g.6576 Transcript_2096/m.6576 type:complete len:233 (+) Transcript_2096:767-1465(+)|eukprot:scaffold298519_cov37-Tisochrysis_lutea.AAC.1